MGQYGITISNYFNNREIKTILKCQGYKSRTVFKYLLDLGYKSEEIKKKVRPTCLNKRYVYKTEEEKIIIYNQIELWFREGRNIYNDYSVELNSIPSFYEENYWKRQWEFPERFIDYYRDLNMVRKIVRENMNNAINKLKI